jgi:hypothetical protein
MTDEGSSTFAIENIRGNEPSFNIPPIEATYTITKIPGVFNEIVAVDLTRNGLTTPLQFDNVENKSYEAIAEELNTKLQNSTFPGKEYVRFYFGAKGIVLYDFLPQSSNLPSLSIETFGLDHKLRTNKVELHTILGWGYYNNTIVLITCESNNNEEDPQDREGFIWAATYDNAANTIQVADLDGDYLNPDTTLRYAGKLELSRQYAIYKHLKCRYENTYTARIVWTDWHNNLRTCNILDPQIFASAPELFSYTPIHLPQKPIISIINGGFLPTGKYQYFYQLSSDQGAVSTFSPLSNLIIAYPGDSINYATPGSDQGANSQKSMQVFIQNIDTNYDTVRVGYVVYQTPDNPEAFFFDERAINADSMTFTHNGETENDVSADDASLANLNRPPEIFKTIDVVRNRLFAANAKTRQFDLSEQFDARAYRYDSNGIAKLYNSNDGFNSPSVLINITTNKISIEGDPEVPLDYTLIPDSFDCINPFNQEKTDFNPFSNGDWYANSQYKYQQLSPYVVIGGRGLNISYQFVTKEMTAKSAFFSNASPFINPLPNYDINYTYEFSDTYSYPGGRGRTMDCMKNPVLETLFTGYSRGEVYRFGIVFFDLYGFPSYPLWIGDIKFPFAYEEDNIGDTFGLTKLNSAAQLYNRATSTYIADYTQVPDTGEGTFSMVQVGFQIGCKIFKNGYEISDLGFYTVLSSGQTEATFGGWFNARPYELRMGLTADWTDEGKYITFLTENSLNTQFSGFDPSIWAGVSIRISKTGILNSWVSILFTFPTYFPGGGSGGNDVVLKQLGITISLDTSGAQFQNIKDKISGYSYVRLKRRPSDSTRLGTGCIQPSHDAEKDNRYVLTALQIVAGSTYWGFTVGGGVTNADRRLGSKVRLGLQTYYTPNFLGQVLPAFAPGDYLRFIGRTHSFGFSIPYSAQIVTPSFGSNFGYYVASNDFTYKYDDGVFNPQLSKVPQRQPTNSYLPLNHSGSTNIFPIAARASIPYATSASESTVPTTNGGSIIFRNMASAVVSNAGDYPYTSRGWFTEWGSECIAVTFDGSIGNFPNTTAIYNVTTNKIPFYLASYERYLIEQYGGWTRADRYDNQYILTNHFQPIDGASDLFSDVYGGDTYVNYFDYQRTNVNFNDSSGGSGYDTNDDNDGAGVAVAIFFPAESLVNTDLNVFSNHAAVRGSDATITASNYRFNPAYSQQNTTNVFISKGYNQSNVIEEPHTIYPSQDKKDGESADAWRTLLINDALSVNGNYGEINRIIQFKDKLFYYQNDGVGVAAVDERILVNEGDVTQTQLGTGTVLKRFDYISTETGCKHSFAVESTGSSIYHYDSFINKVFKYSVGKTKDDISGMNPITDVKGLAGFFRTAFVGSTLKSEDKILRKDSRVGIVSAFNSEYNTIYFTFFDEEKGIQHTISYNELIDGFESFYDFYPSMYLDLRKRFVSLKPDDTFSSVYTHNAGIRNTFYGSYYPSSVTFRVNENSDFVKTFDNFQINSEVILDNLQLAETVSRMSITNDYQNFPEQNVNFVQKIRSWRLAIPRDETNPALTIKPRISDKYIDVKFTHNPLGLDKTFRLHDVLTEYSMRSKIVPK